MMRASFDDYYLAKLQELGVTTDKQGKPIEQMNRDEIRQLAIVESYKNEGIRGE